MAPKKKTSVKKDTSKQTAGSSSSSSTSIVPAAAMGKNAAQATMNSLKRLEKSGRSFPIQHYKSLSTAGKRDFAAKLEVDKEASFLEIQEQEWVQDQSKTQAASGWCFLWDVARLNGINYTGEQSQVEFLKTLVKGCDSKDCCIFKQ